MRLPSKIIPYNASSLSKFPLVLNCLEYTDLTPGKLYHKTRKRLMASANFMRFWTVYMLWELLN